MKVLVSTLVSLSLLCALNSVVYAAGESAVVTAHQDCNAVVNLQHGINKSPLNGKSLNPICQACISLQDDYSINSQYAIFGDSTPPLSICQAPTIVFPAVFVSDFTSLCNSRGGTASGPVYQDGIGKITCTYESAL